MNDEHVEIAKTAMIRIVTEKIPQAKPWSVSKELISWIDGLSGVVSALPKQSLAAGARRWLASLTER